MNKSTLTLLTFLSALCGIGSAEDLTCLKENERTASTLYAHLQQEAYAALIETIARAGVAIGVDGLFIETHPRPADNHRFG